MSDKDIGAITEIDGKNINDVDETDRKNWAENLCDKLEKLDGVVSAFVDSYHNTEFTIAVELEAKDRQRGYKIIPELRVLGKDIRDVVDNDKYASENILENNVMRPEKKRDLHESKYYMIEISYP